MSVLFGTALLWPLAAALVSLLAPGRRLALHLSASAAAPAVLLALFTMHEPLEYHVPWLLMGAHLGIDGVASPFLLCTAILWLAASVHASGYLSQDPKRSRFSFFFLVAMSGNFGFVVAQDIASAFTAYTTMSFAGYGLVTHAGTVEALRAGRVYIAMALVSEVLLLAAAMLAVAAAGGSIGFSHVSRAVLTSPWRDVICASFFAGFGIKAGTLLLHVWLPMAHAIAPTPASAVLSGAMVKVGVLGWLRVFSFDVGLPQWGAVLIVAGLSGAIYAVLVGFTQRKPKAILAYSTVSQLGLVTSAIGASLLRPYGGTQALTMVGIFVAHHALVKGALFLGVGVAQSVQSKAELRAARAMLAALALAMVGSPLTGGAVAKVALKTATEGWLLLALTLSSAGSAMLMLRFLERVWLKPGLDSPSPTRREWVSWGALAVLALILPWVLAPAFLLGKVASWGAFAASVWPLLAGGGLAAWLLRRGLPIFEVPTGDLAALYLRVADKASGALSMLLQTIGSNRPGGRRMQRRSRSGHAASVAGVGFERWGIIFWAFLVVVCLLLTLQTVSMIRGDS